MKLRIALVSLVSILLVALYFVGAPSSFPPLPPQTFPQRVESAKSAAIPGSQNSTHPSSSQPAPAGPPVARGSSPQPAVSSLPPFEAGAAWRGSVVRATSESADPVSGNRVRRTILLPPDLPYPIELSEVFTWTEQEGWKLAGRREEIVADRFLVQLTPEATVADLEKAAVAIGASVEKRVSQRGLYRVRLSAFSPGAVRKAAGVLSQQRTVVRHAEVDPIVRAVATTPNDPQFANGSLWGLHNTGQSGGTADADMDAPEAWDIRTDAGNVVVAVIDTGIRHTHEDLAGNMWVNAGEIPGNGLDDDGNGFVDDLHGINAITDTGNSTDDNIHGTHVAGTIGALGNNGLGVTGVAWEVQLMACKFLSASGSGATSDAVQCIDYAVEHGADILNNSWGGGSFNQSLLEALEAARAAEVIVVAAAGNDSFDTDASPFYPTAYEVDNIVSVAATDRNDALASFSNYGFGSVQIAAPGVAILSSEILNDQAYKALNGTSMATPQMSGALALLKAEFPTESSHQIINRLLNSGEAKPALAGKVLTGRRANLANALSGAGNGVRPVNDDFEDRLVLSEEVNYLRTQNHGATREPGEPGAASDTTSVWFSIVASSDGIIGVELAGTAIPTVVSVYTGNSVAALTPVTVSGPAGQNPSFSVVAGTTYHISIAGVSGAAGQIVARVSGPPSNNDIADARELVGTDARDSAQLLNATKEPGEPNHAGNAGGVSVWWKWTAPVSTRVAVHTRGRLDSLVDTLLGVYTASVANPPVTDLLLVGQNDNEPGFVTSRVSFQAIVGRTYYFAVDGKNGVPAFVSINLVLPPQNDDFAAATPVVGTLPRTLVGTTLNASKENGEPNHAGYTGGFSVWYRWTAPADQTVQVDTIGSPADTTLGVYTGNAVNALNLIAQDDDSGGGSTSRLIFNATRNTVYYIAVDYIDYFLGADFTLNLSSVVIPSNDAFANASSLAGTQAETSGTLVGASREAGEPGSSVEELNQGVSSWFSWTAPTTGSFGIYADGETGFTPVISVYTGSALNALTLHDQDVKSGIGNDAFAEINATAGMSYRIQITGFAQSVGGFTLRIAPRAEFVPENDMFSAALELDPNEVVHGFATQNFGATAEVGEPAHAGRNGRRTLWWKTTIGAGEGGRYVVSTAGSENAQQGIAIYTANNPGAPAVNALTLVADNSGSTDGTSNTAFFYTEVAWTAQVGTTYYIGIEGQNPVAPPIRGGRVRLNFQRVPAQDQAASAQVVPTGGGSFVVCNFGATEEAGEPDVTGGGGKRSLWWSFTPSVTGFYQIDTFGSWRYGLEDTAQAITTGTSVSGMDTNLGLYAGSAPGALTLVAENDSYSNESYDVTWSTSVRNSRIIRSLTAGVTYNILVDGENVSQGNPALATTTGEIHLNVAPVSAPTNNNFSAAETLVGEGPHHFLVSNIGGTKETGEPNHGGITGGRSVWWKWTAPTSGRYAASTAGNIFSNDAVVDTVLGVYTGTAVNALATVGSDDDGAGPNADRSALVTFDAVAGVTYYFAVDGRASSYSPEWGEYSFYLAPVPANDDFTNAKVMTGTRWTDSGHNLGATTQTGEPLIESFPAPRPNLKSVWWSWTASVSGAVTVSSYGSEAYTVMGIYMGSAVNSLAPVVVQSNSGDPFNAHDRAVDGTSTLTFNATAGVTYRICIQGAGFTVTSGGPLIVSLDGPPGIPATPTGFTASRTNPNLVTLSWNDVASDEDTYLVERSLDNSTWSEIARTAADATSYDDYTVSPATADYYYRIRGEGAGGVGSYAYAVAVTPTPPEAASSVAAEALDSARIQVIWEDNSSNEAGFKIQRGTTAESEGAFTTVATVAANTTAYIDSGLAQGTNYYYRVVATNAVGDAAASSVAAAVTFATSTRFVGTTAGWYRGQTGLSPASSLTVSGADVTFSAGGTTLTTDSQTPAWSHFPAVTLADGETLRLKGTFRFVGTLPSVGQGFSLGFVNVGGSQVLTNISGNNPPDRRNDYAIGATYGLGGSTVTRYVYKPSANNGNGPFGNIDNTSNTLVLGSDPQSFGVNDTNSHSLVFELTRSGSSLLVRLITDGALYDAGRAIAAPETYTFDGVATVLRRQSTQVVFTDLVVEHEAPSSPLAPRVAWRLAEFGTAAGYGSSADNADPDGDGLTNLAEYALALPPLAFGGTTSILGTEIQGDGKHLKITFLRARSDVTYSVQASVDLSGWSILATNPGGIGQSVTVTDPLPLSENPRRFLRLLVSP